jgi:hypothetical protein
MYVYVNVHRSGHVTICNLELLNYVYIGHILYVVYVVFHGEQDSEVRIKKSLLPKELEHRMSVYMSECTRISHSH